MSFNFSFRFADDEKDVERVIKFIEKQPFNYLKYMDWVYRIKEELLTGLKKVVLAFSDGVLVGNLIFQSHKDFYNFLEFKNARVHEKLQGRGFLTFMIKQAEAEARGKYRGIICDTHSDNYPVIRVLKFLGYEELLRVPLYDKNVEEIIFGKRFERTDKGIFVPIKKKILERSF